MKICHITTVHDNRYDVRIFEKECTTLSKAGYSVTLIVNDNLQDEEKNGVQITSLKSSCKGRFDRTVRIANLAYDRALLVDADLYHIHDPELLRIAIKLRKIGKKVIFDSHEFTGEQIITKSYIPQLFRNTFSMIYNKYESYALNRLSGLVMPCLYDGKDYFENVNIPKVTIGNYPIVKSGMTEIEKTERNGKICYVGLISENRGALQMVKAAAISKKKLVLIGEISSELKNKILQMDESEWVEFKGVMSHSEALKEVAKCSVGLCLLQFGGQYSKLNNLPTKLYEYMMLKVPTVISNFKYYESVIERYRFGITVNPTDANEIARAINELFDNDSLYSELQEQGIKAINNDFNWENDGKRLVDFYKEILQV